MNEMARLQTKETNRFPTILAPVFDNTEAILIFRNFLQRGIEEANEK